MTTTDDGVAIDISDLSVGDETGADAFLAHFMKDAPKKKEPSEEESETPKSDQTPEPKSDEETSEETPEETEEGGDEETETKEAKKVYVDDDEAFTKIKLDEKEHEVPVKELKRLWGQEQALTRKSQEVAELRKTTDTERAKHLTGLSQLLQRAQARFEPYSKIDFLVAAQQLSPDDLTALRKEALSAYEDVKFLETELTGHVEEAQKQQKATQAEQAQKCVASLRDPDSSFHIEGWDGKVYDEVRSFAVENGLGKELVNDLVDPAAIKLLHMAMQYQKGQSKVKTTKVNKTPKKIVKSTKTMEPKSASKGKVDKALARLRDNGSTDDAAEAFLAKWSDGSSD